MKKPVRIIGVPMDLGQSLRGVDIGPGAVRYAGLRVRLMKLGYMVEDAGNLDVPVRDTVRGTERDQGDARFLPAIVACCEQAYAWGRQALEEGFLPLFIGGDHSIAVGTVGGVTHEARTGLLWIDAHADLNTPETSPSGNVHGMPLAALLGHGAPEFVNLGRPGPKVRPEDVVLLGLRDVDPEERVLIHDLGLRTYTMRDVDERSIAAVAHEAIEQLAHVDHLHVSFDLDSLDPVEAPGVGTPVPGGLTYREAHLLMEILADSKKVASIDVVEVNPILDERNHTAGIAVELIASLLGQTIL